MRGCRALNRRAQLGGMIPPTPFVWSMRCSSWQFLHDAKRVQGALLPAGGARGRPLGKNTSAFPQVCASGCPGTGLLPQKAVFKRTTWATPRHLLFVILKTTYNSMYYKLSSPVGKKNVPSPLPKPPRRIIYATTTPVRTSLAGAGAALAATRPRRGWHGRIEPAAQYFMEE